MDTVDSNLLTSFSQLNAISSLLQQVEGVNNFLARAVVARKLGKAAYDLLTGYMEELALSSLKAKLQVNARPFQLKSDAARKNSVLGNFYEAPLTAVLVDYLIKYNAKFNYSAMLAVADSVIDLVTVILDSKRRRAKLNLFSSLSIGMAIIKIWENYHKLAKKA